MRKFVLILLLLFPCVAFGQSHFTGCLTFQDTGSDATVIIPHDVSSIFQNGEILESGDEIAAVTADSVCAGATKWEGSAAALSVAGPSSIQGTESGFAPGDTIRYAVFDSSKAEVYDVGTSVTYTCDGNPLCRSDGVWAMDALYELARIGSAEPIPVELASFTVSVDDSDVVFVWETLSETNNARFEIERKEKTEWEKIGTVYGAGTTDEAQSYRYRAEKVPPGYQTFRIKQVDTDGTERIASTERVLVSLDGTFELTKVYPNPITDRGRVTLTVERTQDVTAELYNVLGQKVAVLHSGTVKAYDPLTITVEDLTPGVYFVMVRGENFKDHRSLVSVGR
mgnify:CR=1 FL=1